MTVLIDNKSGTPIYDQIYSQIKSQIISGSLGEDEMLTSIRSVPGKGCYVARKNTQLLQEEHLKQIEEHMEQIIRLAAACNLSREDILEMMKSELEDMA